MTIGRATRVGVLVEALELIQLVRGIGWHHVGMKNKSIVAGRAMSPTKHAKGIHGEGAVARNGNSTLVEEIQRRGSNIVTSWSQRVVGEPMSKKKSSMHGTINHTETEQRDSVLASVCRGPKSRHVSSRRRGGHERIQFLRSSSSGNICGIFTCSGVKGGLKTWGGMHH